MTNLQLSSTSKRIMDIPWNETIYVSKIFIDQTLLEHHKERINKVFATASNEIKEQQLQNVLMRDTLFNLCMDKIVKCYEFNITDEDKNAFVKMLNNSAYDFKNNAEALERIEQIAIKLIQKELIFIDIASSYDIKVTAEETLEVLNQFQQATGNSIEDIKQDKTKLNGAVSSLLEEKITAFIINKFDKNFDELQKNINLDAEQKKQNEHNSN